MSPALDIAIVNWNGGNQLRECLESIVKTVKEGFTLNHVIVVDNNSEDDSLERLPEKSLSLQIIKNTSNMGFAKACNQAARICTADYILFLNPDTRLFKDSLRIPIRFMELPDSDSIGICGIQLIQDDGQVSRSSARYPSPGMFVSKMLGLDVIWPERFPSHFMAEWDHLESRFVDHVIGAFYLVRKKAFEDLGGFDERFFVYLEDLDFSCRANRAGWKTFYLSDAKAFHEGGGSSSQDKGLRIFYSLRSRILYGYKHFSSFDATMLLVVSLLFEPLARIFFSLAQGHREAFFETLNAYHKLWSTLPEWIAVCIRLMNEK